MPKILAEKAPCYCNPVPFLFKSTQRDKERDGPTTESPHINSFTLLKSNTHFRIEANASDSIWIRIFDWGSLKAFSAGHGIEQQQTQCSWVLVAVVVVHFIGAFQWSEESTLHRKQSVPIVVSWTTAWISRQWRIWRWRAGHFYLFHSLTHFYALMGMQVYTTNVCSENLETIQFLEAKFQFSSHQFTR